MDAKIIQVNAFNSFNEIFWVQIKLYKHPLFIFKLSWFQGRNKVATAYIIL